MSAGSLWAQQLAQAEQDAKKEHPRNKRAQRRFTEKRLGYVSRETLNEEAAEAERVMARLDRAQARQEGRFGWFWRAVEWLRLVFTYS